jgi:hypothetical protein
MFCVGASGPLGVSQSFDNARFVTYARYKGHCKLSGGAVMLAKTFSFWRRIVGPPSEVSMAQTGAVHDNRRLWVRYATELHGNIQLADNEGSEKVLAKVRDLSLGGANLQVDRPMKPGQMLTVELPVDTGEVRTVLACIVRAAPEEDGKWELGCVFARELNQDDLGSFGAHKVPAADDDQRTWVRFSSSMSANYRKVGEPVDASHRAEVLNISATGIGLAVPPSLEAGALINIDLHDRTGRTVRTILACVVHTTQRNGGDCAVGCNFIRELSEEELQSLL